MSAMLRAPLPIDQIRAHKGYILYKLSASFARRIASYA